MTTRATVKQTGMVVVVHHVFKSNGKPYAIISWPARIGRITKTVDEGELCDWQIPEYTKGIKQWVLANRQVPNEIIHEGVVYQYHTHHDKDERVLKIWPKDRPNDVSIVREVGPTAALLNLFFAK